MVLQEKKCLKHMAILMLFDIKRSVSADCLQLMGSNPEDFFNQILKLQLHLFYGQWMGDPCSAIRYSGLAVCRMLEHKIL
jgi:hypothetical protein